jgi:hypothetical protein
MPKSFFKIRLGLGPLWFSLQVDDRPAARRRYFMNPSGKGLLE